MCLVVQNEVRDQKIRSFTTPVALCFSAILLVLGATVIVGWILSSPALISASLGPAMNEKTAICFILAALGMASLANKKSNAVAFLPAVLILTVVAVAFVPSLSEFWNQSVGPFIKGSEPALSSRMSIYTAVSFVFIALALMTVSFEQIRGQIFAFGLFGPFVVALGIAALLCFAWGILPKEGRGLGSVSFLTSIGILCSGISITALELRSSTKAIVRWIPLLSGISAMIVIAVVCQSMFASQDVDPKILRIIGLGGFALAVLVISMSFFSNRLYTLNSTLEERVRLRTQELLSVNAELQKFSAVAAHDLRSPIATIVSFAQLFLEEDDLERQEVKTYAGKIVDAGHRSLTFIDQLLKQARTEKSKVTFEKIQFSKFLQLVLFNLDAKIRQTNAVIETKTDAFICGDEVQLIQLFQNLIANALKFTAPGVSPRIEISSVDRGEFVEFSVKDNGIGIPKEQAAQVFEFFGRADTTKNYEGTGLGLAVCQKIVEAHGGKIWFESNAGLGTTFFFNLKKPG